MKEKIDELIKLKKRIDEINTDLEYPLIGIDVGRTTCNEIHLDDDGFVKFKNTLNAEIKNTTRNCKDFKYKKSFEYNGMVFFMIE